MFRNNPDGSRGDLCLDPMPHRILNDWLENENGYYRFQGRDVNLLFHSEPLPKPDLLNKQVPP